MEFKWRKWNSLRAYSMPLLMETMMMMMISFVQCVLICFCLPFPLNSECLESRTELYPCVSSETVLAILKANKFNTYRSELNELKFQSKQGPACHYWLWSCLTLRPSLPLLAYLFFSIYKEGISYLPFRDAVKMHLTLNAKLYLNLWRINI